MICVRFSLAIFVVMLSLNFGFTEDLLELSCDTNADCLQFKRTGYNTTCLNDKCICNDNNGQQVTCKPQESNVNNIIGGPCPCTLQDAECVEHEDICYCKKDFIASSDKRRCLKKSVFLDDPCDDNSQCIRSDRFSECSLEKKICICQKGFIKHSDMCISTIGLDDICQDDLQCENFTENSICVGRKCACAPNFVANSDKLKCLKSANYREACIESNQCKHKLGAGSECYSGFCACDVKHYKVKFLTHGKEKHMCERNVEYGDYCREHNQCYQYHKRLGQQSMECFLGECVCLEGYHLSGKMCISNDAAKLNKMSASLLVLLSLWLWC